MSRSLAGDRDTRLAPFGGGADNHEGRRPGGRGQGSGGRGQGRGIYDRRRQQANEHWPLAARFNAWLFRHPELLLAVLGRRAPVRVEGKVLNRSIQAMLELVARLQALYQWGDGTPGPNAIRKQLVAMALVAMPVRTDVHVTGRTIPPEECPEGCDRIALRVYRRFGAGVGAQLDLGNHPAGIVYYHGGGWISGDLVSHDSSCRLLAAVSGCVVVAVEYRLAPEHPFPAARDDAVAAYAWVVRHARELGVDPDRIGVMGDSAGGNLAAVVALQARPGDTADGAGLPTPVAQGLVYPSVALRTNPQAAQVGEGFFLTIESMEQMRAAYVPDESNWDAPAVSPLFTPDMSGAPPALVVTAGFDPLHYDGIAYVEKLRQAGVAVEHRHYDDQVHGFFGMGILADSLALSIEVCDAMGRLMYREDPTRHPAAD